MKSIILLIFLICSSNVFSAYGPIVWRGDTPEIQSRQITFKTNGIGIYTVYEDPTIVGVDATTPSIVLWQDPASDDGTMYIKRGPGITDYSIVLNGPSGVDTTSNIENLHDLLNVDNSATPDFNALLYGDGVEWQTRAATEYLQDLGVAFGSVVDTTSNIENLHDLLNVNNSATPDINVFLYGDGTEWQTRAATEYLQDLGVSFDPDATSGIENFHDLLNVNNSATPDINVFVYGDGAEWQTRAATEYLQDLGVSFGTDTTSNIENLHDLFNVNNSATPDINVVLYGDGAEWQTRAATEYFQDLGVFFGVDTTSNIENLHELVNVNNSATPSLDYLLHGDGSEWAARSATEYLQDLGVSFGGSGSGVAGDCCWIVRQHTPNFTISGSTGDNISDITDTSSDCTGMGISVDISADMFVPLATGALSVEGYNTFNNAQHSVLLVRNETDSTDFYVGGTCSDTDTTGTENTHCPISFEATFTAGKAYEFITRTSGSNSAMFGDVQSVTAENVDAENYKICKVD